MFAADTYPKFYTFTVDILDCKKLAIIYLRRGNVSAKAVKVRRVVSVLCRRANEEVEKYIISVMLLLFLIFYNSLSNGIQVWSVLLISFPYSRVQGADFSLYLNHLKFHHIRVFNP